MAGRRATVDSFVAAVAAGFNKVARLERGRLGHTFLNTTKCPAAPPRS